MGDDDGWRAIAQYGWSRYVSARPNLNSGEPWSDVAEWPIEQIADFLCRDVDEIAQRVRELGWLEERAPWRGKGAVSPAQQPAGWFELKVDNVPRTMRHSKEVAIEAARVVALFKCFRFLSPKRIVSASPAAALPRRRWLRDHCAPACTQGSTT